MLFNYVTHGMVTCPTCEVQDLAVLSHSKEFPAVRCNRCGLGIERYLNLDPDAYRGEVYAHNRDECRGVHPSLRWHHDVAVATCRYNQIADLLNGTPHRGWRWTDVGCSAGAVLTVAARHGMVPLGVECDPSVVTAPYPVVDFRTWVSSPLGYESAVVSAFDVIEHMPDPTAFFRAAVRDSKGLIVVEVPDLAEAQNFDAWKHRRITTGFTEHVFHFDERSLRAMAERYAPGAQFVRATAPVKGKLQAVWRT